MESIVQVSSVPRLYFTTAGKLRHEDAQIQGHITHILHIEHSKVKTKQLPPNDTSSSTTRTIQIQTPEVPDVLSHLDDISTWASQVLSSQSPNHNSILIHPSSPDTLPETYTVLLGLTMFYHHSSYSTALTTTIKSLPNFSIPTFLERQLRIWHFCTFSITFPPANPPPALPVKRRQNSFDGYVSMPGTWPLTPISTAPSSPVAQPVGSIESKLQSASAAAGGKEPHFKPAYLAWQKERDALIAAARMNDMGKVVARLARTRLEHQREVEEEREGVEGDVEEARRKAEQWQRVEDMERGWNEKLIRDGVVAT